MHLSVALNRNKEKMVPQSKWCGAKCY